MATGLNRSGKTQSGNRVDLATKEFGNVITRVPDPENFGTDVGIPFGGSFVDTFDRVDQPLDDSPNWVAVFSQDAAIVNHEVTTAFTQGWCYWNAIVTGDIFLQGTVTGFPTDGRFVLGFMDSFLGTLSPSLQSVNGGTWRVMGNDGGSFDTGLSPKIGDVLRLERLSGGTTVRAFVNGQEFTYLDSSPQSNQNSVAVFSLNDNDGDGKTKFVDWSSGSFNPANNVSWVPEPKHFGNIIP